VNYRAHFSWLPLKIFSINTLWLHSLEFNSIFRPPRHCKVLCAKPSPLLPYKIICHLTGAFSHPYYHSFLSHVSRQSPDLLRFWLWDEFWDSSRGACERRRDHLIKLNNASQKTTHLVEKLNWWALLDAKYHILLQNSANWHHMSEISGVFLRS